MKSGVTSGTHHIFFPPRLYVAVAEPMPDGDGRDASDLIFLDQPLLQKLQGPVIPPLGRGGAGQGDEIGLRLRGGLPWRAGAGGGGRGVGGGVGGGVGAGQGYEIGLGLRGELPWLAGAGGVVEGAREAVFTELIPDPLHRAPADMEFSRYGILAVAFVAHEQYPRAGQDPGVVCAPASEGIQL